MKKLLFIFSLIFVVCATNAQKHVAESTSLVGLWQQHRMEVKDGTPTTVPIGVYKMINSDNTYYTFIAMTSKAPDAAVLSRIVQYGTYTITSDSTYFESVVGHSTTPQMVGKNTELRYKQADKNTLFLQYKMVNKWIPEVWHRVTLLN